MKRRDLLLAGLLLGLTGCIDLPSIRGPSRLERLSPPSRLPSGLPRVGWQLAVDQPAAPAQLAGDGIAVRRSPYSVDYYDNVVWAETAPGMVQDLLIAAFARSGRITAVGPPSADVSANFLLETELTTFQAAYWPKAAAPMVEVRMTARLLALPTRQVVGTAQPHDSVRASSGRLDNVLAAFDEALGRVLDDVVGFTLTAPSAVSTG
jgi:cholesterol transport system auxiliary component